MLVGLGETKLRCVAGETDLTLRCSCGAVAGVVRDVSPSTVNRVVCYCRFCQQYLEDLGKAEHLLDDHGGTDIFQISPRQVLIIKGLEYVRCLQLTPKGALRWYAKCCNTPVANTLPSFRFPFVAILHDACIDRSTLNAPIESYIGSVRAGVNHQFAKEKAKTLRATKWAMASMILRMSPMTLGWALRGDHRQSPFFDSTTGEPIAHPRRQLGGRSSIAPPAPSRPH